jgi:hypothetical protein
MHPKLDWEYVTAVSEKKGNSCGPHLNPSHKMENYALFFAPCLDQKEDGFWAFANTYSFVMPNHFNGGKEEMSTM